MGRFLSNFLAVLLGWLFVLFVSSLHADPWGPDADLVHPSHPSSQQSSPYLGSLSKRMIGFHQDIISPADGPRSHFYPSSSQYTMDAIEKYGFLQGIAMGCDRLMRENNDPWVYREIISPEGKILKWNPVP